jgi:hypothetical protein
MAPMKFRNVRLEASGAAARVSRQGALPRPRPPRVVFLAEGDKSPADRSVTSSARADWQGGEISTTSAPEGSID